MDDQAQTYIASEINRVSAFCSLVVAYVQAVRTELEACATTNRISEALDYMQANQRHDAAESRVNPCES